MLEKDPKDRLGNKGIHQFKAHPWFRDINWNDLESKTAISPFIPDVRIESIYIYIYVNSTFTYF
jgi:hypothetical protein